MLMDTKSSLDILSLDAYLKLGMSRTQIRQVVTPLVEFTRDAVSPLGVSNLTVTMRKNPQQARKMVEKGSRSKRVEEGPDRSLCTLHVPKESPKKGRCMSMSGVYPLTKRILPRCGEHPIRHRIWDILLEALGLQTQECWGHISADGEQNIFYRDRQKHGDLLGRHAHK
ncbi:hypothetical protein LIER_39182 [Lithospermum erythrorhizon]|uniref:Uncharacterized protein n=1 Tax=Lithospermum erythrorhizon TaxID=34254 RepID=A0AAV3QD50_LITER